MIEFVIYRADIGSDEARPIEAYRSSSSGTLEDLTLYQGEAAFEVAHPEKMGGKSGDEFSSNYLNVVTGDIGPRPAMTLLGGGSLPLTVPLDHLPPGTTVTLCNEAGDELVLTDLSEPVTLPDAGTYIAKATAPFPWLPLNTTIEVV